MKKIIIIALLLYGAFQLYSDSMRKKDLLDSKDWSTHIENAKLTATQSKKYILVDFWASWCGPCKIVDQEIFQNKEIMQNLSSHFVILRFDVSDNNDFAAIKQNFPTDGLPTIFFLSNNGQILDQYTLVGYPGKEFFLQWVEKLIKEQQL